MDGIAGLGVLCSPFLTLFLILVPIYIADLRKLPPEHKEYQQTIKNIETEYQTELEKYDRQKYQNRVSSLTQLRKMKPVDFEKHIAYVFNQMGYQARETKHSGDGGIDVEARRDGKFIAIQCKRYAESNKISSPELRNFIGAMAVNNADIGYFITTSSFTRPAQREAAQVPNLTLVDGQGIIKWWQEYEIGPYKDLTPPKKRVYPPAPPPIPPVTIFGFLVWQWIILVVLSQMAVFVCSLLFMLIRAKGYI